MEFASCGINRFIIRITCSNKREVKRNSDMKPGAVEPKIMTFTFLLVKLALSAKMQPREKFFSSFQKRG